MIGVVDYSVGNIRSICKAIEALGYKPVVLRKPEEAGVCSHIVLPGVGAFRDAIANIDRYNWRDFLSGWKNDGRPLLGICLGMQLLFEYSYEGGIFRGIGVFRGNVVRFSGGVRIPHMGWNTVEIVVDDPLFDGIRNSPYFYFVHSFYADTEEGVAFTTYGGRFPSVVKYDSFYGVQFHPEKSGDIGLKLLENFLRMSG